MSQPVISDNDLASSQLLTNSQNGVSEELQSLLGEKLATVSNKEAYDPTQEKSEKRWLRKQYRDLIVNTEENKRDLLNSDCDGLIDNIAKANELFKKVKNPYEATLDARLLVLSADIGTQKARRMKIDSHSFDTSEYIAKMVTLMGGRQGIEDEEGRSILNWDTLGDIATNYTARAPSMDFILGPLATEQKTRQISKQRARLEKDKAFLTKPQELKEGDIEKQENETTKNVQAIASLLEEHGPINYFEFIINPESFSQTVENIFYLSFLIRDGKAYIDDESGQPILEACMPPTQEDYAQGLVKKQLILELDLPTWQVIIDTYNIRQSVIPTRRKKTHNVAGKWYG
ncbi:hypothetical protein K7432_004802 [Basidiobolus ranarum]|uniref:Non-structural maintenance of chromosomes element 4 n=1 Tax=Basidiobolus ranarum TaxID=34480 RepID=A0ABR2W4A1_9FUNG